MIYKKIPLGTNKADATPFMMTYILDDTVSDQKKRPLIVICPGGGYAFCSPREGEPIATTFNSAGFHAVVVEYSTHALYPEPLRNVSDAVKYCRAHAEEWNADPEKIIVCGFSAGGHAAASLGTLWNKEKCIQTKDRSNRPDAMILAYPVITSGEYAHRGSFDNLTGNNPDLLKLTSLENQVDSETPPAFLWHTVEDKSVPVENSMLMAQALRKNNVSFEMHLYPQGYHGLSLAKDYVASDPEGVVLRVQAWIGEAIEWVRGL